MKKNYDTIKALNWSSLKEIYVSPRNFLHKHHHPVADKVFFSLGRIIHMEILEPEKFADVCTVRPEEFDSWRTKASKEWKKEQIALGKEIMTHQESLIVGNIVINFSLHPDYNILKNTSKEQILEWKDSGVNCKGRLDAVSNDKVIDLKTTNNLSSFIRRDLFRYLYHGQLAWYLNGAINSGFTSVNSEVYIIACETSPPFDVAIFRIGDEIIETGRALKDDLLHKWISCKTANIWPGIYPNTVDVEDVPSWAPGRYIITEEGF